MTADDVSSERPLAAESLDLEQWKLKMGQKYERKVGMCTNDIYCRCPKKVKWDGIDIVSLGGRTYAK